MSLRRAYTRRSRHRLALRRVPGRPSSTKGELWRDQRRDTRPWRGGVRGSFPQRVLARGSDARCKKVPEEFVRAMTECGYLKFLIPGGVWGMASRAPVTRRRLTAPAATPSPPTRRQYTRWERLRHAARGAEERASAGDREVRFGFKPADGARGRPHDLLHYRRARRREACRRKI